MLVGPNGAGKSTFLGLAAGLIEPSNGDAWVQGAKLGTLTARAATSYLPDAPVLYDDLSLNEHIEYIARMHNTQDWEDYADDLLDMFNLTERADDLPSRFSRGLKQKTALILGLIRPFSLLLIDEPFVGLDTPGPGGAGRDAGRRGRAGRGRRCARPTRWTSPPRPPAASGLRDGEMSYDGPASAEKIRSLVGRLTDRRDRRRPPRSIRGPRGRSASVPSAAHDRRPPRRLLRQGHPERADRPRRRPPATRPTRRSRRYPAWRSPSGAPACAGWSCPAPARTDHPARPHGRDRQLRLRPGGFEVDRRQVTLVRAATAAPAGAAAARTASGSVAVPGAPARMARASRILVEGVHDAELVEKVWGDDLRVEGVVVELLDGADHLSQVVRGFGPRPGRRLGVLLDHLVDGSKESSPGRRRSTTPTCWCAATRSWTCGPR